MGIEMSLMIFMFISVECKRPATVRRRRMVKRLGGQISVGWISIVLDYSPLLLINSREGDKYLYCHLQNL